MRKLYLFILVGVLLALTACMPIQEPWSPEDCVFEEYEEGDFTDLVCHGPAEIRISDFYGQNGTTFHINVLAGPGDETWNDIGRATDFVEVVCQIEDGGLSMPDSTYTQPNDWDTDNVEGGKIFAQRQIESSCLDEVQLWQEQTPTRRAKAQQEAAIKGLMAIACMQARISGPAATPELEADRQAALEICKSMVLPANPAECDFERITNIDNVSGWQCELTTGSVYIYTIDPLEMHNLSVFARTEQDMTMLVRFTEELCDIPQTDIRPDDHAGSPGEIWEYVKDEDSWYVASRPLNKTCLPQAFAWDLAAESAREQTQMTLAIQGLQSMVCIQALLEGQFDALSLCQPIGVNLVAPELSPEMAETEKWIDEALETYGLTRPELVPTLAEIRNRPVRLDDSYDVQVHAMADVLFLMQCSTYLLEGAQAMPVQLQNVLTYCNEQQSSLALETEIGLTLQQHNLSEGQFQDYMRDALNVAFNGNDDRDWHMLADLIFVLACGEHYAAGDTKLPSQLKFVSYICPVPLR